DHDLALEIYLHVFQLLKVSLGAIICIDHVGLGFARWRVAIEWRHYSGIVLEWIIAGAYALTRRSVHLHSRRRGDVHADLFRHAHPHAIFHYLRLQSSRAKSLRHIFRRLPVFRGTRNVRLGGEYP